ncbi:hypothetical protein [Sphaerotilus uruguayifluvii]|uniref:Big-1 domain-containing protein n=1 Tax=Sphaerotilus uruguayifluvii TaxID=2735897 RepID=A0ABX2G5B9_9BURK|nr:hypothetical protein [Leptothrix sp. C29]NRT56931.1 hypothetical protein [Leptothrix sp. C29]
MTTTMFRVSALALAAASILAGCGGGGSDAGCSNFASSCSSTDSPTGSGPTTTTTASASIVVAMSSDSISASTPGTVTAQAKNADGTAAAGVLVTFSVANGAATVDVARVKTDASGQATTTLQPVSGQVGADVVTASFTPSGSSTALTAQKVFTVSATNVSLTAAAASPASISSYGASVVTVTVSGASSASPVTVNFSSTCATAGKAVLSPASITVTGSSASTTYQDKGCASTDRISASLSGTSQQKQVDLVVATPIAQSLEFVSASPDKICLAGSGCAISSQVSFKLKDPSGGVIANRMVAFSLDIPNVAILGATSLPTDANGVVTVSVAAKSTPTPVRVRAKVLNADGSDAVLPTGSPLMTLSNVLAINAGLPTQNAFSFAASAYNPDGWSRDGTESDIRVQLNDRFANPVPDGTVISFVAEGASVIPAKCSTVNGVCTTKFVTSNYRPADGRVTVLAYAQGEESFVDADGDQKYTAGENFVDLGPVFVDSNENSVMDSASGEYIAGSAANGSWDGNTYVRLSRLFVLSDASRPPRLQADSCSGSAIGGSSRLVFSPTTSSCRITQMICVRDANTAADALGGNRIPVGATLAVSTKAKGASIKIDNSPITSGTAPTTHLLTAELDDCTKALEAPGAIDLTIKMPNGQSYTYDLGGIN